MLIEQEPRLSRRQVLPYFLVPFLGIPTTSPETTPPTFDGRFAVCVAGHAGPEAQDDALARLGEPWYLDWYPWREGESSRKIPMLRPRLDFQPQIGGDDLTRAAEKAGPRAWILGNEPNLLTQDNTVPKDYAVWLAGMVHQIRLGDPSSTIVAPNTHNFREVCRGCGGHQSGRDWVESLLTEYQTQFGAPIPIDAWGLHLYDIDWRATPMVNAQRLKNDVMAFRELLDTLPSERGKPIWITEVGMLWGFNGWAIESGSNGERLVVARGGYATDAVLAFMQNMLGWLANNAEQLNIKRWFWFATASAPDPGFAEFGGAALFSGPDLGAGLTPFGELYRGKVRR